MISWLSIPAVRLVLKGLAVVAVVWFVAQWIERQQVRAVQDAIELRDAQITAETLRGTIARVEADLQAERERRASLEADLQRVRTLAAERTAIFNKHNFGALLQAKPGLIEARINAATAKVWADIEVEAK